MKKYLVLYRSSTTPAEQVADVTPEQMKAVMEAWGSWARRLGPALVELGSPVGQGLHVTEADTIETTLPPLGGYSIVQAESEDAATELLNGHPHFISPGASIEMFEFIEMPGA